jgi:transcriptional regulator with XRE-family HTH domain
MGQLNFLPRFEGDRYKSDDENLEDLRDFTARLRKSVFYTPEEVEEYFGLHRTTIQRYENGKIRRVPLGYLAGLAMRLAEGEKVPPDQQTGAQAALMGELNKVVKWCPGYQGSAMFFEWPQLQDYVRNYLATTRPEKEAKEGEPVKWPVTEVLPEQAPLTPALDEVETLRPVADATLPPIPARKTRRWRLVVSVLLLLVLSLSLTYIFLAGRAGGSGLTVQIMPLPGQGPIVTGALNFTEPDILNDGRQQTISFKVRNSGPQVIYLNGLTAAVRGPEVCSLNWNAVVFDFPVVSNLTLRPGEEYQYRSSRAFDLPGYYFAEPVLLDHNGRWAGIWPYMRTGFKVLDSRSGETPGTDCLVLEGDLKLSRLVVKTGQPVTATFRVRNVGRDLFSIKQLAVIVRGGDAGNFSNQPMFFQPVINLTIKGGDVYDYTATRSFSEPGEYLIELGYQNAKGEWNSIWPYNRVRFKVETE